MIQIKESFFKEQKINKRCIHFSSKQNIKAPLIMDMYACPGIHGLGLKPIMSSRGQRKGGEHEILIVIKEKYCNEIAE